jgi:hypothetical protein
MTATQAYAKREFQRFLRALSLDGDSPQDRDKALAVIQHMQETARKIGMSQYEMETTYDADALLNIYRQSLNQRH